jgi:hypothetical protein
MLITETQSVYTTGLKQTFLYVYSVIYDVFWPVLCHMGSYSCLYMFIVTCIQKVTFDTYTTGVHHNYVL